MNDTPILQVQDVTKAFGGILALSRFSLDLHEGEILGLIGPNGSGKTTLINCITGFINLTAGKVFFRGKNITGKAAHKIADMGITRTFQIMRPYYSLPAYKNDMGITRTFQIMRPYYSLPAYKNLVIPLFSPRARRTGGWGGGGNLGDRNTVSIDILEEMGFERESFVPYKMASTLPTGYLKRLELARCLSLKPEIILCDEVFSGLSMSEIASMVPLIERLQMDGITLIMIEHRLRELFRVANRVMVMNFGEKLIEGTAEEVMADEKVKEAYFGSEKVEEVTGYA
jgi:branched-chain amino acid transport system ATP-binding protein